MRALRALNTKNRLAGLLAVFGSIFRLLILFAFTIILANSMSKNDFGIFSYYYSWVSIFIVLLTIGFGPALNKIIPSGKIAGRTEQNQLLTSTAKLYCAFLAVTSSLTFGLIGDKSPWAIVYAAGAAGACLAILIEMLRAHGNAHSAIIFEKYANPILILAILSATYYSTEYISAPTSLSILYLSAIVTGFLILLRGQIGLRFPIRWPGRQSFVAWRGIMFAGLASSLVLVGFSRIDILVLGIWSDPEMLAEYAIAQRIAEITSMPQFAIAAMAAPLLSARLASKNRAGVQRILSAAIAFSTIYALVFIFGLALFGEHLVLLYGESYRSTLTISIIIAAGYAVMAATGVTGMLLMMSGNHNLYVFLVALGVVLKIGAIWAGWHAGGIWGAAVGSALGVASMAVVHAWFANRRTGFRLGPLALVSLVSRETD